MKKLFIFLVLVMFASEANAITWTKSWSSADDGSPFSGSDVEDIQDDIDSQVPTVTGTNSFTGTNTFSGTINLTGTVTGITGSSSHAIVRGFELTPNTGDNTQVYVEPGTLFHGTTSVNKTARTTLDINTAAQYIGGADLSGANTWLYVYTDASGNILMHTTAPDKADTAGNTTGTKYYYYHIATTTYYRFIGAIRLGAATTILNFHQSGNLVLWDVPINITTALSAGVWSAATSCASAMPSNSLVAIFGLYSTQVGGSVSGVWIRPNGSSLAADVENGIYIETPGGGNPAIGGQRISMTDSSNQINYFNDVGDSSTSIDIEGFYLNR